jgi:hypothetical protein
LLSLDSKSLYFFLGKKRLVAECNHNNCLGQSECA